MKLKKRKAIETVEVEIVDNFYEMYLSKVVELLNNFEFIISFGEACPFIVELWYEKAERVYNEMLKTKARLTNGEQIIMQNFIKAKLFANEWLKHNT